MGTVVVRALATSPPRAPATITATRRPIKSAANTGNCASWSSAKRYSIARVLPSTKPVSRSPRLKASRAVAASARDRGWRTPIVNCVGCCARAARGQAATEPTVTLMKSRRRIAFTKAGLRRLGRDYSRDLRLVKWGSGLQLHSSNSEPPMSALGQKRTSRLGEGMSAKRL
jgi:hypothetical protein